VQLATVAPQAAQRRRPEGSGWACEGRMSDSESDDAELLEFRIPSPKGDNGNSSSVEDEIFVFHEPKKSKSVALTESVEGLKDNHDEDQDEEGEDEKTAPIYEIAPSMVNTRVDEMFWLKGFGKNTFYWPCRVVRKSSLLTDEEERLVKKDLGEDIFQKTGEEIVLWYHGEKTYFSGIKDVKDIWKFPFVPGNQEFKKFCQEAEDLHRNISKKKRKHQTKGDRWKLKHLVDFDDAVACARICHERALEKEKDEKKLIKSNIEREDEEIKRAKKAQKEFAKSREAATSTQFVRIDLKSEHSSIMTLRPGDYLAIQRSNGAPAITPVVCIVDGTTNFPVEVGELVLQGRTKLQFGDRVQKVLIGDELREVLPNRDQESAQKENKGKKTKKELIVHVTQPIALEEMKLICGIANDIQGLSKSLRKSLADAKEKIEATTSAISRANAGFAEDFDLDANTTNASSAFLSTNEKDPLARNAKHSTPKKGKGVVSFSSEFPSVDSTAFKRMRARTATSKPVKKKKDNAEPEQFVQKRNGEGMPERKDTMKPRSRSKKT